MPQRHRAYVNAVQLAQGSVKGYQLDTRTSFSLKGSDQGAFDLSAPADMFLREAVSPHFPPALSHHLILSSLYHPNPFSLESQLYPPPPSPPSPQPSRTQCHPQPAPPAHSNSRSQLRNPTPLAPPRKMTPEGPTTSRAPLPSRLLSIRRRPGHPRPLIHPGDASGSQPARWTSCLSGKSSWRPMLPR